MSSKKPDPSYFAQYRPAMHSTNDDSDDEGIRRTPKRIGTTKLRSPREPSRQATAAVVPPPPPSPGGSSSASIPNHAHVWIYTDCYHKEVVPNPSSKKSRPGNSFIKGACDACVVARRRRQAARTPRVRVEQGRGLVRVRG